MTDSRKSNEQLLQELESLRTRVAELEQTQAAGRQAEESLGEHDSRLRAVIEGTTDAVFLKDLQGRYLIINSTVAKIMQKAPEDIIGKDDTDLLPEQTARQIMADDRRVLDGGEPLAFERIIPVEGEPKTFLSTKSAYRDHRGRVVGLIGISRDITKRKRAEEALRDSEARLAGILESAMDAIVTVDEDRRVTLFNAAAEKVFRCPADQAVGSPVDRFLSEPFKKVLAEYQDDSETRETAENCMWLPQGLTARRADGDEFPVEASISRVRVGGQWLYTLILRDINELHRAEAELHKLQMANVYLQEEIRAEYNFEELVGASPMVRLLFDDVERVAGTDSTVLLVGETGTGKELIARAIHNRSNRRQSVLVKVNCAALPAGLIESELFGHEQGAFTGALSRKIGRFELADGGTIFLDEIGDLPLELQAKLLRVLQEGEFERVGGLETKRVDVRVVAATHQELPKAVDQGRFRPDLFYRLNVFPIRIPPLRERREDIPLLVRHFALRYGAKLGKRIESIPQQMMQTLVQYNWPGNVRELQNVIERAVIISTGPRLELGDWLRKTEPAPPSGRIETLVDHERAHILEALNATGWRVSGDHGAAKLLGVRPTTLESKMRKLGIERPRLYS